MSTNVLNSSVFIKNHDGVTPIPFEEVTVHLAIPRRNKGSPHSWKVPHFQVLHFQRRR